MDWTQTRAEKRSRLKQSPPLQGRPWSRRRVYLIFYLNAHIGLVGADPTRVQAAIFLQRVAYHGVHSGLQCTKIPYRISGEVG
jgi:hypothetical protein